ncbi:hypothetical protein AVEN_98877-1 [Araneus ventricosus]|uniref:Secreted protein n=1 Tax=Araneus ventricosus TaxID=182803 RepID=A0A4Y2FWY4_ARAVE|nr:hypothetical protein AVEN_98877-1 [Araneus ventricosus]
MIIEWKIVFDFCLLLFNPVLMQHDSNFGADIVIFSRGHRTTPQPASPSINFRDISAGGGLTLDFRFGVNQARIQAKQTRHGRMGLRTWNPPVLKPRSCHQTLNFFQDLFLF